MSKISIMKSFARTFGMNKSFNEKLIAYTDLANALGLRLWVVAGESFEVTTIKCGGAMPGRLLTTLQ